MTGVADPSTEATARAAWRAELAQIGHAHGFFDEIAPGHSALFVQEGNVLLVSFDTETTARAMRADARPLGFAAVQARQMSLLSVIAERDTWFRSTELEAFFAGLAQEGFFDSFEQVLFVGLGPMGGHAACVYSATCPGAKVIVANPVATLEPSRAGFDRRFRAARRLDFSGPFGRAPEALAAARQALLFYDPVAPVTAAHAAQFSGANLRKVPIRFMVDQIPTLLDPGPMLVPLLRAMTEGGLTLSGLHAMLRAARRSHVGYLLRLAARARADGHPDRAARIVRHGARVTGHPQFNTEQPSQTRPEPQPAAPAKSKAAARGLLSHALADARSKANEANGAAARRRR